MPLHASEPRSNHCMMDLERNFGCGRLIPYNCPLTMPSPLCETSFYPFQMLNPLQKSAPQDKPELFKCHETKTSLKVRISLPKTRYPEFTLCNWELSLNNRTMGVKTCWRVQELQQSLCVAKGTPKSGTRPAQSKQPLVFKNTLLAWLVSEDKEDNALLKKITHFQLFEQNH